VQELDGALDGFQVGVGDGEGKTVDVGVHAFLRKFWSCMGARPCRPGASLCFMPPHVHRRMSLRSTWRSTTLSVTISAAQEEDLGFRVRCVAFVAELRPGALLCCDSGRFARGLARGWPNAEGRRPVENGSIRVNRGCSRSA
jgi:hypothetical protein